MEKSHTCISIRTYVYIISEKLPTFKSNPFQCHELHYKCNLHPQIHMDCFIYWFLHIFADLVALVFMMLRNSCFLGCFMLFPPLPRPHLIPPMAAGCLGCGPQWPPKISCPGWHPRRHSHQETSENLRSKFFDVVHGGTSLISLWKRNLHHNILLLLQTMFFVSVYYLIIYPKRTFNWGCTANI